MDRARAGQGWQSEDGNDSVAGSVGAGQKKRVTQVGGPFTLWLR